MHTGCNSSPNSFHHVEIGPQPLLNCHDAVILSRRRSWSSTSSKHQAASIKQQAASERTIKRNTTHPSIISTSKQSKHQVLLSLLSLDLIKLGRRQPLLSIRLDSSVLSLTYSYQSSRKIPQPCGPTEHRLRKTVENDPRNHTTDDHQQLEPLASSPRLSSHPSLLHPKLCCPKRRYQHHLQNRRYMPSS